MKSLPDRKSGFIRSLFVVTFLLVTPAQADSTNKAITPAWQDSAVSPVALERLKSMGLYQSQADLEQAMGRWHDILVNIGHLDQGQPVSDGILARLLVDMQPLVEHIVTNKNSILIHHTQNELSADSQQFLKYLTSHTLETQQFSDKQIGGGKYFSRRLNTSRVGEKYRQVTLYKSLRDLIRFWQQSPQLVGELFQGQTLSVQQVRKMLERGELDESIIATYSLEKAHSMAAQRQLYSRQ